jgi:hypothetical protein
MLRSVEHATAEWAAQSLGEQEVNEASESLSMGSHDSRDAVNLQRRVVKRPIVLPSEIMNLPKLSVSMANYNFAKLGRRGAVFVNVLVAGRVPAHEGAIHIGGASADHVGEANATRRCSCNCR